MIHLLLIKELGYRVAELNVFFRIWTMKLKSKQVSKTRSRFF